MSVQNEDHFATYDLPLSACMVALGHTIDYISRESDGGRAKFCFQRSERLQQDVTAYWKQELRISPKILFESLKFTKSLLYSGMDQ